jgi:tetratricopeptide (TPR) repeat protein
MSATALKFKHASVPRQSGERSRLKVVRGPDFGSVYVITGPKATVGRGEDCDIVLSDLKSSRTHAEVFLNPRGEWNVKDLNSSNGIAVNGKAAQEAILKFHDTFTLGETTLEFLTPDAGTQILSSPARSLETIQNDSSAFQNQKRRVQSLGGIGPSAPRRAGSENSIFGNSKVLLVLVGLGAAFYLMPSSPKRAAPVKKADDTVRDLASFLPGADSPTSSKAAESFFKLGFREYLEGNYLRAKTQFETALQIVPNHSLARLYLENCDREIKEEVDFHLDHGRKSADAGKTKEAKIHFEAVMRLLYRDQANPSFIEAKDLFDKLNAPTSDVASPSSGGSG